jgi:hypothetical protein
MRPNAHACAQFSGELAIMDVSSDSSHNFFLTNAVGCE